ncbi:hypothetical protein [Filifactor villosus]|uniref:Lipoprotein n=1 Tax=Filifactor villosus TaxID=29374 RepID=A0ABV9QJK9_9FIRM
MKKYLGLCIVCLMIVLLVSCGRGLDLSKREGENFTVYSNEDIEIKLPNSLENREEVLDKLTKKLEKLDRFEKITKVKITINPLYNRFKNREVIEVTPGFIEGEEFEKYLIAQAYDLYNNWIVEGIRLLVFGGEEKTETDFVSYYKDREFSLFGARFFEPFTEEEEVNNLKVASADLAAYLIDQGKKEDLLHGQVEMQDIEGWAKEEGIDIEYQKQRPSLLEDIEVRYNTLGKLTVNTRKEIGGFTITLLTEDETYDEVEELEEILLTFEENIEKNRRTIEKEAPNFYREYREVLDNPKKTVYFFDNTKPDSMCDHIKNEVILSELWAQMVEYNHKMFEEVSQARNGKVGAVSRWLEEGLDSSLLRWYSDELRETHYRNTLHLFREVKDGTAIEARKKTFEVMEANFGELTEEKIRELVYNDDSRDKLIYIMELIDKNHNILEPGIKSKTVYSSEENKVGFTGFLEPNNYNFFENRAFVYYLMKRYGLEKMFYLRVKTGDETSFEEEFGKSLYQLREEWKAYLRENIRDIDKLL